MQFIDFFRSTAPYIHAHRNKLLVILMEGKQSDNSEIQPLIADLALLNSLGLKLVILYSADSDDLASPGQPVSKASLQRLMEIQGAQRITLEAQFSMGLINSPMHNARIRCISGNFVQARPMGVINGTDLEYQGEIRSIDSEAINQHLSQKSIVLMSPVGYSPTGEAFALSSRQLATATASALKADKLVILSEQHQWNTAAETSILSLLECRQLLAHSDLDPLCHKDLTAALHACQAGVTRCHLLAANNDGGLLRELFTRDGDGVMVTNEAYDSVRPANIDDVGGILQLLGPLEDSGVLVRRSRELLEQEIAHFVVNERDGMIVGCAALYPYDSDSGELACVAVHEQYRHHQRGDLLLEAIVKKARSQSISNLYVLTTQTAHWFLERGFVPVSVNDLPEQKKKLYNYQRNSKIFSMDLTRSGKKATR